jgi:5'-methylthioadenosine phosphorylase
MIIGNLHKNALHAQQAIQETVKRIHENPFVSKSHSALKHAILTPLDRVPAATREKLRLLLEKE